MPLDKIGKKVPNAVANGMSVTSLIAVLILGITYRIMPPEINIDMVRGIVDSAIANKLDDVEAKINARADRDTMWIRQSILDLRDKQDDLGRRIEKIDVGRVESQLDDLILMIKKLETKTP